MTSLALELSFQCRVDRVGHFRAEEFLEIAVDA